MWDGKGRRDAAWDRGGEDAEMGSWDVSGDGKIEGRMGGKERMGGDVKGVEKGRWVLGVDPHPREGWRR